MTVRALCGLSKQNGLAVQKELKRIERASAYNMAAVAALELESIRKFKLGLMHDGEIYCADCVSVMSEIQVARLARNGGTGVKTSDIEEHDFPRSCGECLEYLNWDSEFEYLEAYGYDVDPDYLIDFIDRMIESESLETIARAIAEALS